MRKSQAQKLHNGDEVIEKQTGIVWTVYKIEQADNPAIILIYVFDGEDDSDLHLFMHTEVK